MALRHAKTGGGAGRSSLSERFSRLAGRGLKRGSVMMGFDYSLDFLKINFREHPELYRVGRGEQGVLLVEPYKSEMLPYWRFRTAEAARRSAEKIYRMYLRYKRDGDFVGMDMARKFLQMGYTRSRRYANHKGGRKYTKDRHEALPLVEDEVKAESAEIFREKWRAVREDPVYLECKRRHRELYETSPASKN